MRFMVLVKANADSEAGVMPNEEILNAMGKFNEELVQAGVMLAGEGLHPSSKGVRVKFSGKDVTVTDGPFPETNELVAGFWIWKCDSMDDAVAWLKRSPFQEAELEIRQVFSPEDFGDAMSPELEEQEAGQRARSLGLEPPRLATMEAKKVAGPNKSYSMESRMEIPKQWESFAPQIGKVPGQAGPGSYGVSWNYKPGEGFDYLCGVEVADGADLSSEYTTVELKEGRYAVFPVQLSSIMQTIDKIWSQWLPQSGYESAAAPCFEYYSKDFSCEPGKDTLEFWLPLKS